MKKLVYNSAHEVAKSPERSLRCPTLKDLPPPPTGKAGWPWTQESQQLPDRTSDGVPWPRISIVTPSYNHGRFIEEAIRSVLLQGYSDLEYIIIDGGSTDQTVEIIKKYEPWLTYWESEPDRGQSHAINKGLAKSTGRLFNWHNSDDVLMPNSLATAAAAILKYPQAGYVHGGCILIDAEGTVYGNRTRTYDGKITFEPDLAEAVATLQTGYQPGCLMDKGLAVKAGMLDENMHYIMDVDILLRIALVRPPLHISTPLVYVRIHPAIKSKQWNNQRAGERINIANKIFSHSDLPVSIGRLKRQSLATAHQFAWLGGAKAGNYSSFLWHLFLDIFYSFGGGWRRRIGALLHIPNYGKLPTKD
jgi:glycosyltransferase involved in cell wall biosynthesis